MMIGMLGVLFGQAPDVEVVVEATEAGRRQLDGADAAEGVRLQRVLVADVGVLLGGVGLGALHVLGMADADAVR